MLSVKEIQSIVKLIDQYHIVFIGQHLGAEFLSESDRAILLKAGIDISKLPLKDVIKNAFSFGLLAKSLKEKKNRITTFLQFKDFVDSGFFIPFSEQEKEMIASLKMSLYSDIKGLGNKVSADFSRIAIEANPEQRLKYEKIIHTETKTVLEHRGTVAKLASEIGHKTGDWSRDLDRIADFQLHRAYCSGKVASMMKSGRKLEDIEVYVKVFDSACEECIEAYLTDGLGSKPKVFPIIELLKNGTNIGRKQKDWLPVIPPMHPWCRCEVMEVPENSMWVDKLGRFVIVRNKSGVKRKSKVHITVNGKEV